MNAAEFLSHVADAGAAFWRASWQASVLAALVCIVQLAFGRRIPARWRHTMWMLVLVRLALPVVPSSPLSVFNLTPALTPEAPQPRLDVASVVDNKRSNIRTNVGTFSVAPDVAVAAPITPQKAAPPRPPDERLWTGWPQILVACWLAGVVLLALRVAWATFRVSRVMRRLNRVDDPAAQQVLRDAAAELRIRRLPVLLTGDGFFDPTLVGFARPRLLLPADLLRRFEPAELRLVLLHELAHLKRRDVAVNWFATLLTMLHWPNPVAWLVAWRLRLERELACDELVLSAAPADADRRAYGHTIVKLLETFSRAAAAPARPMPGAVGILEGKQQMKRRITMIAQFAGKRARGWTVVAAVLVLGLGAVALTDAVSAEPPATKPSQTGSGDTHDQAATEYVIGPNDLIQVTVFDLEGVGLKTPKSVRVGEAGSITMPYLKEPVKIAGLTAGKAQLAVAEAYQKNGVLLDKANVSVDVVEGQNLKGTIGGRELVTVSIMDLVGQGVETVKTSRVDDDGSINLPYVGPVQAKGLKSVELEKAISKAYNDKGLVKSALVVVSLPGRGESHTLSNRPARAADPAADPLARGGGEGEGLFGAAPAHAEIDPATAAQLDKKLPEAVFEGVGLSDVIDFLRDVTSANIFIDWRALEEAGIDRNAPVTLRVKDVRFKDALTLILRGINPNLYHNVENNVIQIGVNAPKETEKLVVKTYDVTELLGGALKGSDEGAQVQELMSALKVALRGNSSMSQFGTRIIISASESEHQGVESLLKMLREQPASKPASTK